LEKYIRKGVAEEGWVSKIFHSHGFSDELRINEPGRRIFIEFCNRIELKPSDAVHVGDSIAEDVGGALSAGVKAVYINRIDKEKQIGCKGSWFCNNV